MDERLAKPTDNYQFLLNTFNWLAHKDIEIAEIKHPLIEVTEEGPVLSEEEKDDFTLIKGAVDVQTSDVGGAYDPSDVIVERAREISYDFLIMCDYDNYPPNPLLGAINAKNYTQEKGYDMHITTGVEANRGWGHCTLFPITLDVWEREFPIPDLEGLVPIFQEIVEGGGIVKSNHPTLLPDDFYHLYYKLEEYSINAIDVINSAIQVGGGDAAVRYPFMGAADSHEVGNVDRVIQYLYVRNVSDSGIVDAILNKRSIVYTPSYDLWIGQKVWLDEYFSRMEEAEPAVASAEHFVSLSGAQGRNVTLASKYLDESSKALANMNPDRAIRYSNLATISAGITVNIEEVPEASIGEETNATVLITSFLNESVSLTIVAEGENWVFPGGNNLSVTIDPGETRSTNVSMMSQILGMSELTARLFYGSFELSSTTTSIYVIPEFPTGTPVLLMLMVLTAAIAIYKRRLLKPLDQRN